MSDAEAIKYREALYQLWLVVRVMARPQGGLSDMSRAYLAQHDACKQAADLLGTDRLDDSMLEDK